MASTPPVFDPNAPRVPYRPGQGFPTTIPPDGPSIGPGTPGDHWSPTDNDPAEPNEGGEEKDFPQPTEPVTVPEEPDLEVEDETENAGTVVAENDATPDAGSDAGTGDSGGGDAGGGDASGGGDAGGGGGGDGGGGDGGGGGPD